MKGFSTRNLKYMRTFCSNIPRSPTISLILCKTKDQVVVEYALRDMNKAIGLAQYHLAKAFPESLQTVLPTIEELEADLSKDFEVVET